MIARVARITRQPVGDLFRHPELWPALEAEAESQAWTDMHELAAGQVELLHGIYRLLLGAFSQEGTRLPKPLVVEHPARPSAKPKRRPLVALSDFLGQQRKGRVKS